MNSQLSEEDQIELQRRRLTDDVYKSVEETLKRRYTWLAIVISFVLGGGVVLATNQLTKSATNTLTRHQVLLEQAENALTNVNKLAGSAQKQLEEYQNDIDQKVDILNKDISGVSEGKKSLNDRLTETLNEINKINKRVDDLSKAINDISKNKVETKSYTRIATNIQSTLDKTQKGKYTIYVHYKDDKNKSEMNNLAGYLKGLGYTVPAIRQVDYKVKDVRYYHAVDEAEATEINTLVTKYFDANEGVKMNLRESYLGDKYKNVREGTIELWLYMDN